ncbi:MAG TPA: peptidylprolyl isomerase [Thermoguttaceae bacterium]|nr:peptidylprolyl isomerase [Thermoguttaceae bacterium]
MSVCIRLTLVSCLSLLLGVSTIGAQEPAAEPKPPAPEAGQPAAPGAPLGPKNQAFQKLFSQWEALLAEIRQLRAEYNTADANRKQQIATRFNELVKQGRTMTPQIVEAAQQAYAEAPNASESAGMVLMDVVEHQSLRENYEAVLPLAEALIQGGYPEKSVYAWAGLAALVTCRLDAAEKYLKAADEHDAFPALRVLPPDHQWQALGQLYQELIPYYRKAWPKEQAIRAAEAKADDLPRVLLVTSQGEIELEMFENEAPNTVANFISLVEKGYYNGLTFHRVIPGFMAQGGCPDGTGSGGPGYTIPDECKGPDHRLHFRGSLSMAKTAAPDSGGSQFFLNFAPTKHLDGKHTVFGRIIRGTEVLAELQRRNPQAPDAPEPDKILEAKVLRKRDHEYVPKKAGE